MSILAIPSIFIVNPEQLKALIAADLKVAPHRLTVTPNISIQHGGVYDDPKPILESFTVSVAPEARAPLSDGSQWADGAQSFADK